MKTPFIKSKRGFTIIEVSLVLAIGGLIMLMVFIAWPAVQRNQRDSQRRNADLTTRFVGALEQYMSNNAGKLPTFAATNILVEGHSAPVSGTKDAWTTFYDNYLLAEDKTFTDPSGTDYSLSIVPCSANGTATAPNTGLTTGDTCTNTAAKASASAGGASLVSGGTVTASFNDQASTITIMVGARCDGETAKASTTKTGGTRKYAVLYRLESGGVYCNSN